ncbi:MAG: tetratricopeptide repeat protein [Candidatus Krumholzibacteria bacterium]|nr:tetratricopeptide repeat protein [Candidatus Krumholzibacteria bacterium]
MSIVRCWFLTTALVLIVAAPASAQEAGDPCQVGRQAFLDDDYETAEPALRECLAEEESLLALLPLTIITTMQRRITEALGFGARALTLAPDNASVRYWYGRALLLAGDAAQAQVQWEQGLLLDVGHAGILEGLAQLHIQRGEPAKAYNLLHQMQRLGVNEPWLHRQLSGLARRKGQWDQAVDHWRDVIAVEGETEESLVVLGELTILAGRSAEAVDIFRRAVALRPSGLTYGGLGEAWFTADQIDSAAVALQKAVELDPDNPRHRFNLANALELLDEPARAAQHFQAYIEQQPDDPVGRFHYGVHLEHRGQPEAAVAQLQAAVRLDPAYVQAQVVLAELYDRLGRSEEALALVDRLTELDPGSRAELQQWRQILLDDMNEAKAALGQGRVHLLHILTDDAATAALIGERLATGADFADLAAQYSQGPTAARGGDIGWVDPAVMLPALQAAIRALAPGETSPPVMAGGQAHLFKRVR